MFQRMAMPSYLRSSTPTKF